MNLLKISLVVLLLYMNTVTTYAQVGKTQLLWQNAVDAVMYQLEIANAPIKNKNIATNKQLIYTTANVFTPGIELDLSLFKEQKINYIIVCAH